jgi:transcription elongation GreA/GreB family factor
MNKSKVITAFMTDLKEKRRNLVEELNALRSELGNDDKNTSGDKHETSRAMNQIEQERIGKQITQLDEQIDQLQSLPLEPASKIITGSLIQLNEQWFLISSGLGKKVIGSETVFSLSLESPLGKELKGKETGEIISFNGNSMKIGSLL